MNRSALCLLLSILSAGSIVFTSCTRTKETPEQAKSVASAAQLFAYDRSVAIDVKEDSAQTRDGILIRDAHFASCSPKHGQVQFYVVRPAGDGPFPGVLFFHWLGRPKGNREEFLDEARQLAREGVVSLLLQGYFPWKEDPVNGPTDRQQVIEQTIDTRRALELLLREHGIDTKRIAFVGHDYGAMLGAIVSGIESRVSTYVLVAGMGNFGDWSLKYWPATEANGEKAYRDALDPVDPVHFVPHAAPASLFFQFANDDKYISKETAEAFSGAASDPKTIRWYDTQHEMSIPGVQNDRHEWLSLHLGLPKR
jgi:dienelactone hydrolase